MILEGITEIGYNAFRYVDTITVVRIPNSVTVIGPHAFFQLQSGVKMTTVSMAIVPTAMSLNVYGTIPED